MGYIYIISCQRGAASPEIHFISDSYEEAIKYYYEYHYLNYKGYGVSEISISDFMFLYKIPINIKLERKSSFLSIPISDIKLQKSCEFRIKFKSFKELESEFIIINRDSKINDILG